MNQSKHFNEVIKKNAIYIPPLIPKVYQQVEYLQSSGTQHIVTSVPIDRTTETRCVGSFISPGAATSLVGGRNDNATNGRYIPLGVSADSGQWLRFVYDGSQVAPYINSSNINKIVFNDAEHKAYCNDTLVLTITNSNNLSVNTKQNISLFGMIGYNGSTVSYKTKGRLYSASFYNNVTGEKLGDYIPCYRKSDSKPGMYDLVTETFFTNAGTGEFTVGADV